MTLRRADEAQRQEPLDPVKDDRLQLGVSAYETPRPGLASARASEAESPPRPRASRACLGAVHAEDVTEAVTWLFASVLPHDFSQALDHLDEARKILIYEGDDPELQGRSLQDIATEVETAVELAEREAAT